VHRRRRPILALKLWPGVRCHRHRKMSSSILPVAARGRATWRMASPDACEASSANAASISPPSSQIAPIWDAGLCKFGYAFTSRAGDPYAPTVTPSMGGSRSLRPLHAQPTAWPSGRPKEDLASRWESYGGALAISRSRSPFPKHIHRPTARHGKPYHLLTAFRCAESSQRRKIDCKCIQMAILCR